MRLLYSLLMVLLLLGSACTGSDTNTPPTFFHHPQWCQNKVIYELNTRQFSSEGNFSGVQKKLPELKKMGVGIIWLMPIHPVGEKNRKGTLGSPYSIKDYLDVNPDYGTKDDFKALVNAIHKQGMHVIIDWVANHSSWDNPLVINHPEWYTKDTQGNIKSPVPDWSDVADFDYNNPEMRAYMLNAMEFWVKNFNIDGFRCDVAEMVPMDFWKQVRIGLDKIKPVFMLAEGEQPYLHENGFDMTYSWNIYHGINSIAKGKRKLNYIDTLLTLEKKAYIPGAMRMRFITNHDENSWNGTVYERLQDNVIPFTVLYFTIPGTPLIYSGQEAGMDKRLNFFEKDPIDWSDKDLPKFFTKLDYLYMTNPAFNSGQYAYVPTDHEDNIYGLKRWAQNTVFYVFINISSEKIIFKPELGKTTHLKDIISGKILDLSNQENLSISANNYLILKAIN